jgi:subtilisin family serine protease
VKPGALARFRAPPDRRLLRSLRVEIVRPLVPDRHLYLVRSSRPGEDGLSLVRRLTPRLGEDLVRLTPDLALPVERRSFPIPPDDPRYGGQWYLEQIGIEAAWRLSPGDPSITIAIVDNGCDPDHPDLPYSSTRPGFDVVDGDEDASHVPGTRGNNHGTACAGVAAARGNDGLGIAGACPRCTLQCVRLLPERGSALPVSSVVEAYERLRAGGAAVVSNSWGYVGDVAVPQPVRAALERLMTEGQQGRGALVVFAAGNDREEIPPDDIAAVPGVVTVTATNLFDELTTFSSFGPSVDLSAPGGTVTTDISGPDGSEPGDHTSSFGGTSAACPLVAGVAGLLFAADPAATAADVRAALVDNARPAPFAEPDGSGFDPEYGYGIVDPEAALRDLLGLGMPLEDAGVADAGAETGGPDAALPSTTNSPEREGCRSASGAAMLDPLILVAIVYAGTRRRAARRAGERRRPMADHRRRTA